MQVRAAMKFQFRDLETFIHPDHIDDPNNRHVKRFKSTKLTKEEFRELLQASRDAGAQPPIRPPRMKRGELRDGVSAQGSSQCARRSTRRAST
jgi:hypothetical protein